MERLAVSMNTAERSANRWLLEKYEVARAARPHAPSRHCAQTISRVRVNARSRAGQVCAFCPNLPEERILGMSASLAASIRIQWRVIVALIIRAGQADYSQKTLGFFWVIGEPLILTCGVIALWLVTNRGEGHGNINIVALAITAYTHLQLW